MVLSRFSYGAASAIVTGMALVVGLNAATAKPATIVSGLLIVAIADNLTDSLSIHIYQEAERLEKREAFRATLTNFGTRVGVSLSFVAIVLLLPMRMAVIADLAWGFLLLIGLSALLARDRGVSMVPEIFKHVILAVCAIVASKTAGTWILTQIP